MLFILCHYEFVQHVCSHGVFCSRYDIVSCVIQSSVLENQDSACFWVNIHLLRLIIRIKRCGSSNEVSFVSNLSLRVVEIEVDCEVCL